MAISARQLSITVSLINRTRPMFETLSRSFTMLSGQQGGFFSQYRTLVANSKGDTAAFSAGLQEIGKNAMALGSVFIGMGAGMITGATHIIGALDDMGDAYRKYQKQVAGTFTQVENKTLYTQEKVAKIGKQMAREFPIPFEQAQDALYDIFSSVEVTASGQVEKFAEVISKSAVGGLTDLETAGRATIQMVNVFGKDLQKVGKDGKVAVDEVTQAGNIMFQTVRKGIGDYDQFAHAIGKSASSARAAGQNVETLSSMLAFMTLKGLTTARAGTSVARAFDMMSKPNTLANLKKIGINAIDPNTRKMRQMTDIVKELREKFSNMNADEFVNMMYKLAGESEKSIEALEGLGIKVHDAKGNLLTMADALKELDLKFEGLSIPEQTAMMEALGKGSGGTIEAMRFFKFALDGVAKSKDGTLITLEQLEQYMYDAADGAGALNDAFNIMNNTDEAKLQKFANRINILKEEFGKAASEIKVFIIESLEPLISWFEKLDQPTKDMVIRIAAIGAGLLVVSGAVSIVLGFFLMLGGAITLMASYAGGFLPLLGSIVMMFLRFNLIVAIVAGVIAIGILLYQNWSTIKEALRPIIDGIVEAWRYVEATFKWVVDTLHGLVKGFVGTFRDALESFRGVFDWIKDAVINFWNELTKTFDKFSKWVEKSWGEVSSHFEAIGTHLRELFENVKIVVEKIGNVLGGIAGFVVGLISSIAAPFIYIAQFLGPILGGILGGAWLAINKVFEAIVFVIKAAIKIITGIFDVLVGIFTGDWEKLWKGVEKILIGAWEAIVGFFSGIINFIGSIVAGFIQGIIDFFAYLYDVLVGHSIVPDMINAIINWFKSLPGKVVKFVSNLVSNVIQWFKSLWKNTVAWVSKLIDDVVKWFKDIWNKTKSSVNNFVNNVINGFKDVWNKSVEWVKKLIDDVVNYFKGLWNKVSSSISNFARNVWEGFKEVGTGVMNVFSQLWEDITSWFKKLTTDPIGAIRDFVNMLITPVIEFPKNVFKILGMFPGDLAKTISKWGIAGYDALVGAFKNVIKWFTDLPGKILSTLGNVGTWLWQKGQDIIGGILGGMGEKWNSITSYFTGIKDKILGFFSGAITWLAKVGSDIFEGLWNGLKKIWKPIYEWLLEAKIMIKETFFQNADYEKMQLDLSRGLASAAISGGSAFVDAINSTKPKVNSAVNNVKNSFTDILNPNDLSKIGSIGGISVSNGVTTGITNDIPKVSSTANNLKNSVKNNLNEKDMGTIGTRASNILMIGVRNTITSKTPEIGFAANNVKSTIGNNLTVKDLGTIGANAGNSLTNNLSSKVNSGASSVKTSVYTVVSGVKVAMPSNAFSGTGWSAGDNLMIGLRNGLNNRLSSLRSQVRDIGRMIKDNKGPKEYDLKLLVPAGQWIMQGLQQGIKSEIPNLVQQLSVVGDIIENTEFNPLNVGINGPDTGELNYWKNVATNYGMNSFGSGSNQPIDNSRHVNVDLDIHTEEVDPKKVAADLGFALETMYWS